LEHEKKMSRPLKKELDYFPLDCEFDSQFKALEAVHGNDGTAWMIHFWQWAYRNEKGRVDTNGARGVFLGENSRITPGKQSEIIKTAVELHLLFEVEPGIYTSNGIQKRIFLINEMREKWRNKKDKEFSKGKTPGKPWENPGKTPQMESESESDKLNKDSLPPASPSVQVEPVNSKNEKPKKEAKPKPQNPWFNICRETFGHLKGQEKLTKKAEMALRPLCEEEGYGPEEIPRRWEILKADHPDWAGTTFTGFSNHWHECKERKVGSNGKPISELGRLNQQREQARLAAAGAVASEPCESSF
jgi:hypothetical protein